MAPNKHISGAYLALTKFSVGLVLANLKLAVANCGVGWRGVIIRGPCVQKKARRDEGLHVLVGGDPCSNRAQLGDGPV